MVQIEDFIRVYVGGVLGILVDNVGAAVLLGARTVSGSDGREYLIVGYKAYPVLCGDIVPMATEDGPSDGRCGQRARAEFGQCEWHSSERIWWGSLTEAEKIGVEKAEDEMSRW